MNDRCRIIAGLLFALQIGACTSPPSMDADYWAAESSKREFVKKHERLARKHESTGALQRARQEWLIISAVIPQSSEPRIEIDRLDKAIAAAVRRHQSTARSAAARHDYQRAQLYHLKTLALQPDNAEAIGKLKKLEMRRAYGGLAQAPKVSRNAVRAYVESTDTPDARYDLGARDAAPTPGKGVEKTAVETSRGVQGRGNLELALRHLSNREYEAALRRFKLAQEQKEAPAPILEKHITEMQDLLAEQHYDNGVSAFRSARYELAVSEFKKALSYDPEHQKARLYLGSASELQMRKAP